MLLLAPMTLAEYHPSTTALLPSNTLLVDAETLEKFSAGYPVQDYPVQNYSVHKKDQEPAGRWQMADTLSLSFNYGSPDYSSPDGVQAPREPCVLAYNCTAFSPGVVTRELNSMRREADLMSLRRENQIAVSLDFRRELGTGTIYANIGIRQLDDSAVSPASALPGAGSLHDQRERWDARVAYDLPMRDAILRISISGENLTLPGDHHDRKALDIGIPVRAFDDWNRPQTFVLEIRYSR